MLNKTMQNRSHTKPTVMSISSMPLQEGLMHLADIKRCFQTQLFSCTVIKCFVQMLPYLLKTIDCSFDYAF
ncbi:hypothetical protein I79_011551 [Cricetulus griseus]|uniref:Uncharacterized protein n=1 Tax=Cricetulus griseus TaxID=10029 RepID=G3HLG3_CRIGR|nr:hypothetical protein I79_011551 [Cricetulus griseus]